MNKIKSILIVEDDEFLRQAYSDALTFAGFIVEHASDASEAFEMANSKCFDLFIVDVMLPTGNAFSEVETQGGFISGIRLSQRLLKTCPDSLQIGISNRETKDISNWFSQSSQLRFCSKIEYPPMRLVHFIGQIDKEIKLEMEKDEEGVFRISNTKNEDKVVDVIFVHGLNGGSCSTWIRKSSPENFFWPEQLGLSNKKYGIWTVGYSAGISEFGNPGMSIDARARNIATQLLSLGIGSQPVVFVTHSMGGLIVKSLIVSLFYEGSDEQRKFAENIRGIVFCGTPHNGSSFANAAGMLTKFFGGSQKHVKEIELNAEGLDTLHSRFLQWHKKHPIPIETFVENESLKRRTLGRIINIGVVVPFASANTNTGGVPKRVDADHFSLVKPSPDFKPIYDIVFRGTEKLIGDAIRYTPPKSIVEGIAKSVETALRSGKDSEQGETQSIYDYIGKAATDWFFGNQQSTSASKPTISGNKSDRNTKTLFYLYAVDDEEIRIRLEEGLSLLEREGVISGWHNRCISPGAESAKEIAEHLKHEDVILLLISSAFIAPDYCFENEMTEAIKRHDKGDAIVIPIILRPCDWHSAPFGKLSVLPKNRKAITSWDDRDDAFAHVVFELRKLLTE